MSKKIISVVFCLLFVLVLIGCKETPPLPTPKIVVNKTEFSLAVGQEEEFTIEVQNAENYNIDIRNKNSDVIEVIDGETYKLVGKACGEAKVTIDLEIDGSTVQRVELNVVVIEIQPTGIEVDAKVELYPSEEYKLNAKILPLYALGNLKYSTSDKDIVTVSKDGMLKGLKPGTATITVEVVLEGVNISKEVSVTVKTPKVESIEVVDTLDINKGSTVELNYTILPEFANQDVTIESMNENIVQVVDGKLKGVETGETTVIIKSTENEEIKKAIRVTVIQPLATSIVTSSKITLNKDGEAELSIKVKPDNALQDVELTWEDGITVENGKVKGLYAGNYKLTISTKDGSNVKREVTVCVEGNELPSLTLENPNERIVLNWNEDFDVTKGVIAEDSDEKNPYEKLTISGFDKKSYGLQDVIYTLTDSDGNVATLTRRIEVVWNYDVQFIGHAGSYYGLMNSEEAIRYAIEVLKYQAVEVDIKQTSDGVFVLSHDDTFGDYTIASTSWSVLKDYSITKARSGGIPSQNGSVTGSPYTAKLCTLEKYLEICKEYNVTPVIELKSSKGITNSDQSRMQALMDVIEKVGMEEEVIFLGSQYNCLIWTRNNGYDYVTCQYLVNSCESQTYLDRCIEYNFDISINVTSTYTNSDEWLAKYKEAGIKISTYTFTQWVDYAEVQKWINKGVDYVTCDWQLMDKLNLPVSSNEVKPSYKVTFKDVDGSILKEAVVVQGKTAAAPKVEAPVGYEFVGWDQDIKNVQEDLVVTAVYDPIEYTITFDANINIVEETKWATKQDFTNELYSDLFNWIKERGTKISGLTVTDGTYKLTRNSTTVTFSSVEELLALDIYDFEKTISNILFKPVTRAADDSCVIVEDENYFFNSPQYRIKYQGVDQWLMNAINTSYSSYNKTYTPTSAGKIQIFFRMHQWVKGTNIPAFNNYPSKYVSTAIEGINPQMPTNLTYTVEDEIILPNPTGDVSFLGWYLTSNCEGTPVVTLPKGSYGNIVLYAKWDK